MSWRLPFLCLCVQIVEVLPALMCAWQTGQDISNSSQWFRDPNLLFSVDIASSTSSPFGDMSSTHTIFGYHTAIYAVGQNTWGELGVGDLDPRTTPTRVPSSFLQTSDSIWQIHTGEGFSVAFSSWNFVYSWGRNHIGQLGLGTTDLRITPTLVDTHQWPSLSVLGLFGSTGVYFAHCDALATCNTYGWGGLPYSEGGAYSVRYTATLLFSQVWDEKFPYPSVMATERTLFYTPTTRQDQLIDFRGGALSEWGNWLPGTVPTAGSIWLSGLTSLTSTDPLIGGKTANHGFAQLDEAGPYFGWGANQYGQLGLGDMADRSTPQFLTVPDRLPLSLGKYSTIFSDGQSKLYAAGRNDVGQLGLGDSIHRSTPTLIPDLSFSNGFSGPALAVASAEKAHLFVIQTDATICGIPTPSSTPFPSETAGAVDGGDSGDGGDGGDGCCGDDGPTPTSPGDGDDGDGTDGDAADEGDGKQSPPKPGPDEETPPPAPGPSMKTEVVAGSVVGGVVFLSGVIAFTVWITRRRARANVTADVEMSGNGPLSTGSRSSTLAKTIRVDGIDVMFEPESKPLETTTVGGRLISWLRGKVIGRGAYGVVYLGLNQETGQLMAVKAIGVDANAQRKELMLEAEILEQLQHPNIVGYLGVQMQQGTLLLFLEYVSGGSLAKMLAEFGAIPEPNASMYMRQALQGLSFLHEKNVIHRDIKPANLLLSAQGVVKIADFGTSKLMDAQTMTGTMSMTGTPVFMAPEVVQGCCRPNVGRKSDIWSIGCTALNLVTGELPYSNIPDMNAFSLIYHLAKPDTVPHWDHSRVSEELTSFLQTALQRDPDDRPTSKVILDHPWVRRGGGHSSNLRTPPTMSPAPLGSTQLSMTEASYTLTSTMTSNANPTFRLADTYSDAAKWEVETASEGQSTLTSFRLTDTYAAPVLPPNSGSLPPIHPLPPTPLVETGSVDPSALNSHVDVSSWQLDSVGS